MSYDNDQGREDLLAFAESQPKNYWTFDDDLKRVVGHWAGAERMEKMAPALVRFGAECAGPVDRAVRLNDLPHNLPRLDRWGPYGTRTEAVEFHPSYHVVGRALYGSGMLATLQRQGQNLEGLTLGFLSSLNGESGHNCPIACTAGIIKALTALGTPDVKERFMSRLLSTDYEHLAHGAQFLTEVQGGSDVGANAVRAEAVTGVPGTWRVYGEKWFCSNATADLILMTARPEGAGEGTRGLGLFLVPRHLPDGSLNGYRIRRLKEKLGTRTMASGEIDFDGALAWNVGPVADGFKNMMTFVINTSRIFNAVGTTAIARRACYVAHGYAKHRKAFGGTIYDYPMVKETLADMRSETLGSLSGTYAILKVMDRIESKKATDAERAFFRVALNLNKTRSAQSSHQVVLSAIEILGGNGAIETFSVLPRLLRDNVVFENWEGTHNVLLVQVLRDAKRLGIHEGFFAHLGEMVADHPRLKKATAAAKAELEEVLGGDEAAATLRMRPLGDRLAWIVWGAAMHTDGTDAATLDHFLDRRLGPTAARDTKYIKRLEAVTGRP